MVVASLEKSEKGGWGAVKSIKTWKRLDDQHLTAIDGQVLWSKSSAGTYSLKDNEKLQCPIPSSF